MVTKTKHMGYTTPLNEGVEHLPTQNYSQKDYATKGLPKRVFDPKQGTYVFESTVESEGD